MYLCEWNKPQTCQIAMQSVLCWRRRRSSSIMLNYSLVYLANNSFTMDLSSVLLIRRQTSSTFWPKGKRRHHLHNNNNTTDTVNVSFYKYSYSFNEIFTPVAPCLDSGEQQKVKQWKKPFSKGFSAADDEDDGDEDDETAALKMYTNEDVSSSSPSTSTTSWTNNL